MRVFAGTNVKGVEIVDFCGRVGGVSSALVSACFGCAAASPAFAAGVVASLIGAGIRLRMELILIDSLSCRPFWASLAPSCECGCSDGSLLMPVVSVKLSLIFLGLREGEACHDGSSSSVGSASSAL